MPAIRIEHYIESGSEFEAAGLLERLGGHQDRLAKGLSQARRREYKCRLDLSPFTQAGSQTCFQS